MREIKDYQSTKVWHGYPWELLLCFNKVENHIRRRFDVAATLLAWGLLLYQLASLCFCSIANADIVFIQFRSTSNPMSQGQKKVNFCLTDIPTETLLCFYN